jgi:hypothetical protein
MLGDEGATGEVLDKRLIDGRALELEVIEVLGERQLGDGELVLIERACFSLISAMSRSPTTFFSRVELRQPHLRSPPALDNLGERLLDSDRTIGQPDKITVIFGHKITKQYRGKLQTEIEDMNPPILERTPSAALTARSGDSRTFAAPHPPPIPAPHRRL